MRYNNSIFYNLSYDLYDERTFQAVANHKQVSQDFDINKRKDKTQQPGKSHSRGELDIQYGQAGLLALVRYTLGGLKQQKQNTLLAWF